MKIINECKVRDNLLSTEKIANITTVIQQEKTVLSQHRHHALFNCFFSLFKTTTLNKRVTSLKKVEKLEEHLRQVLKSAPSQNYR